MDVLTIVTAVLEILLFLQQETVGQAVHLPIMLHTTDEIPCVYHINAERILAAQWYKSSNSDAFLKDGGAVASYSNGDTEALQGYSITDEFALVMRDVNITERGLYRCVVTPSGSVDDCTHDVNIDVYAIPPSSPLIGFTRQADGFRVNCTVDRIYPMASPKFKLLSSATESVQSDDNEDGTFNITTTTYIPCSKADLVVECSYSNLNYDSISSLRIPSCFADPSGGTDEHPTNVSCTDLNIRDPPIGLWIGWTTLTLVVFDLIVMIAFGVKTGCSKVDGRQEDVRGTSVFIFRKPYYATLIIVHLFLFFSCLVYLATS